MGSFEAQSITRFCVIYIYIHAQILTKNKKSTIRNAYENKLKKTCELNILCFTLYHNN